MLHEGRTQGHLSHLDEAVASTLDVSAVQLEDADPFMWPWRTCRPPLSHPLVLHPACAWANVNRATDHNLLHVHHPQRWSAVYFVRAGGADDEPPPSGHLVFRGGRQATSGRTTCSHTYLAVPPIPGSLWLFPGAVPHCVFAFGATATAVRGDRPTSELLDARISVAINLDVALPPPVFECDLRRQERARRQAH